LAHVLAQAVLQLRPDAKLGFGPPIEDGFYYDFLLSRPLTDADFPELEERMRRIISSGQKFEREELPRREALARLDSMGEPYKRAYAEELLAKKGLSSLTFYRSGPFVDMCDGPHVASTIELPEDGFKLRSVAGAYFRGDSRNVMMTRVYAWAFASRDDLARHLEAYERALLFDHKKLGKDLEIFTFDDDIGKGLPLWLPNGTVIRDELEKLMRELEFEADYQRVVTPPIAKRDLYVKTGHLPYYAAHMFPEMRVVPARDHEHEQGHGHQGDLVTEECEPAGHEEIYCLRPMNCPHHHLIFASKKRSYRELPLRLAEYGQTYRYEDSGSISGLLRVRAMTMNDAHIYCTEEQVVSECLAILEMHQRVYGILGLGNFRVRLSTRDEGPHAAAKYVDNPDAWRWSEILLRDVLVRSGIPFEEGPGEAAFYGPKIDFQFRMVTGREETASTVQLDFAIPARLDLRYVGPDGAEHHPYILHRAPLGTHERFVALLLEHFGGAFPTWLSPVQVHVVPVSERHLDYARQLVRELRGAKVRAQVDDANESMGKKIRSAARLKIPNVLVVGDREQESRSVTWRRLGIKEQRSLPFAEFAEAMATAITTRRDS
jgi:threonyl-tRNA synthetase